MYQMQIFLRTVRFTLLLKFVEFEFVDFEFVKILLLYSSPVLILNVM